MPFTCEYMPFTCEYMPFTCEYMHGFPLKISVMRSLILDT